jgi:hypothetical protein
LFFWRACVGLWSWWFHGYLWFFVPSVWVRLLSIHVVVVVLAHREWGLWAVLLCLRGGSRVALLLVLLGIFPCGVGGASWSMGVGGVSVVVVVAAEVVPVLGTMPPLSFSILVVVVMPCS